ncbi:MAG: DNA recombination protein RmuC [bacterium]
MNTFFLILGIIAAFLIGFIISKIRKTSDVSSIEDLQKINTENAVLKEKLRSLEISAEKNLQDLKSEREKVLQLSQDLEREKTFLKTQLNSKLEEIESQKKMIADMQSTLTKDFEIIATKLLEEKSQKFTEHNRTSLDIILNPLKDKIKSFEDKVESAYRAEAAERNTLKGSIEELMKLNKQISDEANNLSTALKGNTKQQGNWGEFVLEKILESSGLIEGENYVLQGEGMGLVDNEGNRFQPDVIINLPDDKHVIIDSKVSLIAYEKLVNSNDAESREKFIKEHITSLKNHVLNLSNKNYQDLIGIKSPDFVLLFVPIESSFSIATQHDKDLFEYAWSRKIVIVTPSTLLATLKTIASIWKQEKQTKNALEIARQAGTLYDKFVGFIEDLKKIGDQLNKTQQTYNEAYSKLHTGKGNLTSGVESLKRLGAKAKKQIDKNLLSEDDTAYLTEDNSDTDE